MNNDEQFTGKTYVGSDELYADVQRCMALVAEMNTGYKTEAEVRGYLRQITGSDIDESVRVFPPFNINYGKSTTFGKGKVFAQIFRINLDFGNTDNQSVSALRAGNFL